MNMEKNKLFGLILAGGRSKRMGGQDKALLTYHGKPQIENVRDLLSAFCGQVFISSRPGQDLPINNPTIEDSKPFVDCGPLGGILSAMGQYPNASWLVMACDLPFVNAPALAYLLKHRHPNKDATAFISTHDGLPEPLCAVWENKGYAHFLKFFQEGLHCPRKILIKSNAHLITQEDPRWLDNVNTPQEYEEAKQRIS